MKEATCEYTNVEAITQREALDLVPVIFNDPSISLLRASKTLRKIGNQIFQEGVDSVNPFLAKRELIRSKGVLYRAASDILWAGSKFLWAQLAVKHGACVLSLSAFHTTLIDDHPLIMNFIAKDLEDKVYSFIGVAKEIWIYHGHFPPYRKIIDEVLWKADFEHFRSILSIKDFRKFINIVGAEVIGFTSEDLEEVYYPEVSDESS